MPDSAEPTSIQEIDLGAFPNRLPDVEHTSGDISRPLHAALVLSGGGAKGSFEVGALQYLYSTGFFAKTIAGTSVGAVNALQLAHGGTPAAQASAFASLLDIWRMISSKNPFYDQSMVLTRALNAMRGWARSADGGIDAFDIIVWPIGAAKAASVVGSTAPVIEPLLQSRAFFDMSPLRRIMESTLNTVAVRNSGVSLRLCVACLETAQIRYVDEGGRLLSRELQAVPTPLGTAPECQGLLKAYRAAVAAKDGIRQSNYTDAEGFHRDLYLQDLNEAKRAEQAAYDALEECTKDHPPVPQPLGLVDATMASAAIPVFFPPVDLAGENYVDGGVMMQLPIEPAVRADPDVIVAINTGRLTTDRKEGFGTCNVFPIALRVLLDMLMPEAVARQIELAERSGKPIFLISPRVEVHDTLDQDPGRLAINIDYGFMCAADTIGDMDWTASVPVAGITTSFLDDAPPIINGRSDPIDPVLGSLADAITRTRMLCWALEYEVQGESMPAEPFGTPSSLSRVPDPQALDYLRELKILVRILAAVRSSFGGLLPPASTSWWSEYEGHEFPNLGTPWDPFNSVAGTRPGATPGTALVVVDSSGSNFLLTDGGRFPITTLSAVLTSGSPASIPEELYAAIPLGPPV